MKGPPQISPLWRPYAEAARTTGSRLTTAVLAPGRSSSRLDDLARRLQRELDLMIRQAFDALPGGTIACEPGCDHCCRTLPVSASPIEVFALIHRLRDSGDLDAAFEARLASLSPAPLPLEALPPCPLLADGRCMVYSSRPLACRGCASADASLCEARDAGRPVPRSTAHQLGAAAMMRGVMDALEALSLAGDPVELRLGLGVAVRENEAEMRWLRGEDVFRQPEPRRPRER